MPRLPKKYKNQLDQLNEDKRREARLRSLLFPLRITQMASIPDTRKQKIADRILELSNIYDKWRSEIMIYWDGMKVLPDYYGNVADLDSDYGFQSMHNIIKMSQPHQIMDYHNVQELWFSGDNYRLDCAIMLGKLASNIWWAKAQDEPNLVSANLWQFPTMDTVLGEGPIRPHVDATFNQYDEHVVVSEGGELLFVPFHNRTVEDVWHMEIDHG